MSRTTPNRYSPRRLAKSYAGSTPAAIRTRRIVSLVKGGMSIAEAIEKVKAETV